MKLISFNCALAPWSLSRRTRLPFIVSAVIKENPDIIFLQEIFFKSDADYIIKFLTKGGFKETFHAKNLLLLSKLPFLSHSFFEFSEQGSIFSWAILDRLYKKAFQVAIVKIQGLLMALANFHPLSAMGIDIGRYREVRRDQIFEAFSYLKKQNLEKIITAGDFNFSPNSSTYKIIREQFGFYDPLEKIDDNKIVNMDLNIKFPWKKDITERIDHFFIKGFNPGQIVCRPIFTKPYSTSEKPLFLSDHYGLMLDIRNLP